MSRFFSRGKSVTGKRVIRLSDRAHDALEDLCDAYARLCLARDTKEQNDAYAALQMRKVELAEYIGSIERTYLTPQNPVTFHVP